LAQTSFIKYKCMNFRKIKTLKVLKCEECTNPTKPTDHEMFERTQ